MDMLPVAHDARRMRAPAEQAADASAPVQPSQEASSGAPLHAAQRARPCAYNPVQAQLANMKAAAGAHTEYVVAERLRAQMPHVQRQQPPSPQGDRTAQQTGQHRGSPLPPPGFGGVGPRDRATGQLVDGQKSGWSHSPPAMTAVQTFASEPPRSQTDTQNSKYVPPNQRKPDMERLRQVLRSGITNSVGAKDSDEEFDQLMEGLHV